MNRSIIITDLTRFKAGNPDVCVAGIDQVTGECVRPLPYLKFARCMELGILPGGILSGEFTPRSERTAPHLEDCHYADLTFHGPCSGVEFRRILATSIAPSVEAGFQCLLPAGKKVIAGDHQGDRSIITLRVAPQSIQIVEDSYTPGKIKLHFTDSAGRCYRFLPVTDLGFYDFAQRHRQSNALATLNADIARQRDVFLRIGISRYFDNEKGQAGYWMQANGIYTFPSVLRYVRSYPAAEEDPK